MAIAGDKNGLEALCVWHYAAECIYYILWFEWRIKAEWHALS